jgi:Ca2+/Na+ antiporter
MQRFLIGLGIAAILIGLLWPWLGKLPLGRLPGDILVERENFRFYLPLTSMLLISGLLTLILWLLRR